MYFNNDGKCLYAKAFTELAIQNGLIIPRESAADTAVEVTTFFNTIIDTIDKKEVDCNQ